MGCTIKGLDKVPVNSKISKFSHRISKIRWLVERIFKGGNDTRKTQYFKKVAMNRYLTEFYNFSTILIVEFSL